MISRTDLASLLKKPEGPAVSIYIPSHCVIDSVQDKIRLKNYLKDAELKLKRTGMRSPEAAKLLEPAAKLLNDSLFWKCQGDGLSFFLSGEGFQFFRVPVSFNEFIEVGPRFHIRPLLSLFTGDGAFYILILSQKMAKLLHCTRFGYMDVTPEQMPGNIEEVLRFDQFEKQRQYHTVGSSSVGKRSPVMSHGQAAGKEHDKVDLLRYFQEVDRAIHNVLKEEKSPLMLAAVDYLQPVYREANKYANLISESIKENPDNTSEQKIHQQAWSLLEPYYRGEREDALKRYRELAGTGYSVDNLKDAVIAAADGKVATLFVDLEARQWGIYDAGSREVKFLDSEGPGAEDLLDLVTINTLTRHGTVYGLAKGELREVKTAAAILRY